MQPTLSIRKMRKYSFLAFSCLLFGCVTQSGDDHSNVSLEDHQYSLPQNPPERTQRTPVQKPVKLVLSERDKFYSKLENRQFWELPRVEQQYQRYLAQTQLTTTLKPRWEQYFGYVLAEVNARGLPL